MTSKPYQNPMIQLNSKCKLRFDFHFNSFHAIPFHFKGCRAQAASRGRFRVHLDYIFFNFSCKPTAEAIRKQCGSFAEAGTPISQPDRPAGKFLRFRQISAEAKPLWIRIMRKACGRRLERFGIMSEFRAEAIPSQNRI